MSTSHTDKPVLFWEILNTAREASGLLDSDYIAERAKVPGGVVFLPDPNHTWDGGSVR